LERGARLAKSFADHRDDGPQVLARSQFGHHAAILAMCAHLGGDHGGKHGFAVFDDCGSSFVAGGFDAKNTHVV
jgi:hypothetical protein